MPNRGTISDGKKDDVYRSTSRRFSFAPKIDFVFVIISAEEKYVHLGSVERSKSEFFEYFEFVFAIINIATLFLIKRVIR